MPSPCAVSGNLEELTGNPLAGFAVFRLVNFGDNIPRIMGNAVLATPVLRLQASNTGVVSGTIWGNDNIDPAGTFYTLTVEDDFQQPIQSYNFLITGANFNLNSATPMSVAPVVIPPTGDTTYLRVDAGNTNLTGTNQFLFGDINNRLYANAYSGSDMGQRIAAALAVLPSTGGVVDAIGIQGAQSWSADPFSGVTKPFTLLLGDTTITVSVAQIFLPSNCQIRGAGIDRTIIKMAAGSAVGSNDFLRTASSASNIQIKDVTIDGQSSLQGIVSDVSLLRIYEASDIRVGKVKFQNAITNCILAHGVIGLDVEWCDFTNWEVGNVGAIFINSQNASTARASSQIRLLGNRVNGSASNSSCVKLASTSAFPISQIAIADNFCIVGDAGGTSTLGIELWSASGQATKRATITGNVITAENNTNTNVFGISIAGNGCTECAVTGNSVYDCQAFGIEVAGGKRVSVSGNSVINSGSGITGSSGLSVNEVTDCAFTGNTIRGYELGVSVYSQNFQTTNCSNNSVSGNIIVLPVAMPTAIGVRVMSNNGAAVVSFNTISSNLIYGDGTAGTFGISLSQAAGLLTDAQIIANQFHDIQVAINFGGNPANTQIIGNAYRNTVTTIGGSVPASTTRVEFNTTGSDFRIEPAGDVRLTSNAVTGNVLVEPTGSGVLKINKTNSYAYAQEAQAATVGATVYLGGKYTNAGAFTEFGQILGAKETSTTGDTAGYLALGGRPTGGGGFIEGLRVTSAGIAQAANGLVISNVAAPTVAGGQIGFGANTSTTIGANGAASALTANPVGYLKINVGGTNYQIPYYNV